MTRLPRRLVPAPFDARARHRLQRGLALTVGALALVASSAGLAQTAPAAAEPPPVSSPLDAPMFYQLLVGEMEAQAGRSDNAFEVMLDAARRLRDDQLYKRAIELAVQARSGDKALLAAKAWRSALPESADATRTQVQLMIAMGRTADLGEPLRSLLRQVGPEERLAVITSVPRVLENSSDKAQALAVAEQALAPYQQTADTRHAALTAMGRVALWAGHSVKALALTKQVLAEDPLAWPAVGLAIELIPQQDDAESLVLHSLSHGQAPAGVHLAYARSLEQRQRMVEAVTQLRLALALQPDLLEGWLSLGANLLDLRQTAAADEALHRALNLAQARPVNEADDMSSAREWRLRDWIHLLLSQAAEQRGDLPAAHAWLDKIAPERTDLQVLSRRAALLAQQGRLTEARRLLQDGAAADQPEPRQRLLAETQLLRSVKRWNEAQDLLLAALRRSPEDSTIMYELAMVAERLLRFDDMEALLRRVIALRPEDPQAYNALGYSLAERGLRLDEASPLIRRAVALAPNDPFIADSLGWLEFRQGRLDEAERLLRRAWSHRPHAEVAAHLGEVLWTQGRRDEASAVWRQGQAQERENEVLVDTLKRFPEALR